MRSGTGHREATTSLRPVEGGCRITSEVEGNLPTLQPDMVRQPRFDFGLPLRGSGGIR